MGRWCAYFDILFEFLKSGCVVLEYGEKGLLVGQVQNGTLVMQVL